MRLVTYTFRGTTRLGALVGDAEVVDLNRACALHRAERGERRARALADFLVPPDMPAFLQAGDPAMDAARAALAHVREHLGVQRDAAIASGLLFRTDEPGFRLEAPVPRPGKVLAVGVNYKDHAEEAKIPLPERPIIFTKLPSCVIGTQRLRCVASATQTFQPGASTPGNSGSRPFRLLPLNLGPRVNVRYFMSGDQVT